MRPDVSRSGAGEGVPAPAVVDVETHLRAAHVLTGGTPVTFTRRRRRRRRWERGSETRTQRMRVRRPSRVDVTHRSLLQLSPPAYMLPFTNGGTLPLLDWPTPSARGGHVHATQSQPYLSSWHRRQASRVSARPSRGGGRTRNDTPRRGPHQNCSGLLLHAQEVKAADAKVPRTTTSRASSARVAATVEVAPDHTGRLPPMPAAILDVINDFLLVLTEI